MSWVLTEEEIHAILKVEDLTRYEYFIKKVADEQVIWSLWKDDGWALARDDAGHECVPVWPHSRYAEKCASEAWQGYNAKPIPLQHWLERWIPGMTRDNRPVAIFPTPRCKGLIVEASRMNDDIRGELAKYDE